MFKTWEELSRKEQLESIVWDAYKDAYGFRPRHMNLQAMSEAELEAELADLQLAIDRAIEREKIEQAEAIVSFEELVQHTIEYGARTRENALRWIAEGEQYNGDWDHLCYRYGLPYGYFNKEVAQTA